jgi:hypothetical protein
MMISVATPGVEVAVFELWVAVDVDVGGTEVLVAVAGGPAVLVAVLVCTGHTPLGASAVGGI